MRDSSTHGTTVTSPLARARSNGLIDVVPRKDRVVPGSAIGGCCDYRGDTMVGETRPG